MSTQQTRAAIRKVTSALQSSLGFRFRLGKKRPLLRDAPEYASDTMSSYHESDPSFSDGYESFEHDDQDEIGGEGDLFVWDVPNPFASPDPSQARFHSLIQAEIAQMRRYELIGPLQSLPDQNQPLHDWDESESEPDDNEDGRDKVSYDEDYDKDSYDEDSDEDSYDYLDSDGGDGDDEDSDDEDSDADSADTPNVIALPRLLHTIPLCFISSPHPSPPPSPSPSPSPPSSVSSDEDTLWRDSAKVYDIAEDEECAARKARRDAYRSRLKALAILGPEAASAI